MKPLPAFRAVVVVVLALLPSELSAGKICDLLCLPWLRAADNANVPTPQPSCEVLSLVLDHIGYDPPVLARLAYVSSTFCEMVSEYALDPLCEQIRREVVVSLFDPELLRFGFQHRLQVVMGERPAREVYSENHPMRHLRHPSPLVISILKSELTEPRIFYLSHRLSHIYPVFRTFVKKCVDFFVQKLDCRLLAGYMMGNMLAAQCYSDPTDLRQQDSSKANLLKTVLLPHYDLSLLDRLPPFVSENARSGWFSPQCPRTQIRKFSSPEIKVLPGRLKTYCQRYDLNDARDSIIEKHFDQLCEDPSLLSYLYQIGIVFPLSLVFYPNQDEVKVGPTFPLFQFRRMARYLHADSHLLERLPDLVYWSRYDLLDEVLCHRFWVNRNAALDVPTLYVYLFAHVALKFGLLSTLGLLLAHPEVPFQIHGELLQLETQELDLLDPDLAIRKLIILLQSNFEDLRDNAPYLGLDGHRYQPDLVDLDHVLFHLALERASTLRTHLL